MGAGAGGGGGADESETVNFAGSEVATSSSSSSLAQAFLLNPRLTQCINVINIARVININIITINVAGVNY